MCTGDAMRLCGHEVPNVQRITACMVRLRAQVSPGCRAVMDRDSTPRGGEPPPASDRSLRSKTNETASAG